MRDEANPTVIQLCRKGIKASPGRHRRHRVNTEFSPSLLRPCDAFLVKRLMLQRSSFSVLMMLPSIALTQTCVAVGFASSPERITT